MKAFLAITATAAGACATLTMLVFLLAASPNSSPAEFRTLSYAMWGVGIVGLGCAAFAIASIVKGHNRRGTISGFAPAPLFLFLTFVLIAVTS